MINSQTTSKRRGAEGENVEQLADFLMFAQRSCFLDLSKDLNEGKISYAQLFLLGCLDQTETLTMSKIAKKMGHSTAAATGLVDRLEKLGYVQRMHAEEDRRKILVKVTENGRVVVRKMRDGLTSSLSRILSEMDEKERAALAPPAAR